MSVLSSQSVGVTEPPRSIEATTDDGRKNQCQHRGEWPCRVRDEQDSENPTCEEPDDSTQDDA